MTKIIEIEGIGPGSEEMLKAVGITTTEDLLDRAATPHARKMLAEKTGIDESSILRWVDYADIYRIQGVNRQYIELLEAAGVDSVPRLAQSDAAVLCAAMLKLNGEMYLTFRPPNEAQVRGWIEQAKKLPRLVTR